VTFSSLESRKGKNRIVNTMITNVGTWYAITTPVPLEEEEAIKQFGEDGRPLLDFHNKWRFEGGSRKQLEF